MGTDAPFYFCKECVASGATNALLMPQCGTDVPVTCTTDDAGGLLALDALGASAPTAPFYRVGNTVQIGSGEPARVVSLFAAHGSVSPAQGMIVQILEGPRAGRTIFTLIEDQNNNRLVTIINPATAAPVP